jgi:Signal transduction histidine kinase
MSNDNLIPASNIETNGDNKEENKDTNYLLKNIALEYEEKLYSISMQLKKQNNLLLQKEQEFEEEKRIKAHNLDLFSPIYDKSDVSNQSMDQINEIKNNINKISNEMMELTNKIEGLKIAANLIEEIYTKDDLADISDNREEEDSIPDHGLGILEAQENERQRIARDLHDTTVQNLTSLVHKSELCVKLIDIDSIRAKLELNAMSNTLKLIINDMRGIIYNLKPMTLDDLGLTITIERFANRIMSQKNIQVRVNSNQEPTEILPVVRLTLFRIIQETCNNVVKHANASIIDINIKYEEKSIKVVIKDDGVGFDTKRVSKSPSELPTSFGLSIMKERISLLSGTLDIKSEKGNGSIVTITIPLTTYEGEKNEQAD